MKKFKQLLCGLLAAALLVCALPAATAEGGAARDAGSFTVTYKTNAGVEMGMLEYKVGEQNALPTAGELSTAFSAFIQRAKQKGNVYVPQDGALWYEDEAFTAPAQFPQGQAGQNYTLYCKLTVGYISAGSVMNGAEDKTYADVGGYVQPYLGVSGYSISGRNDGYDAIKAIFEKKTPEGTWEAVPEEYYTDKSDNTWPNMIYFSSVRDSGTYRLKAVRYTATDNDGEVLYYVDAGDAPQEEYTVRIAPAGLTITGVTAQDRTCDGTNEVQLTGGELQGILYGDDVSFQLGTGTVADAAAGAGKPVETHITLTGAHAGNYTLIQPEGVAVTISHVAKHYSAVAPSAQQPGNIEYWYCPQCGRYFSDAAMTKEIQKEDTVLAAVGATPAPAQKPNPKTGV